MNIDDFLRFADSWSPGFSSRIEPIGDVVLEEILGETRHPLPPLYLAYLKSMGGNPAEFQRPRWTLDPIQISDQASMPSTYPRDRFTLAAIHRPGPLESRTDWYFDHAHPECPIVKFEERLSGKIDEHNIDTVYCSFQGLLVDWGARVFCLGKLPCNGKLQFMLRQARPEGEPMDGMSYCIELMQKLGFRELLQATSNEWLGGNGDVVALIEKLATPETISFFVNLGASNMKALARIAEILSDNLA